MKDQGALAAGMDVRDPDDILCALARMASADITDLYDEHGNLRAIEELPDDVVAAVASIKVVRRRPLAGRKGVAVVQKVEMSNKLKVLELLARLRGLLHERSHVRDDAALLARLDRGRKRAAADT